MDDVDTWYVLADGTRAHPAEVEHGEDGVLRHKNGVHVALRANGLPLTSGVATKNNKQATRASKAVETKANGLKPGDQQGAGYTTRESKAQ